MTRNIRPFDLQVGDKVVHPDYFLDELRINYGEVRKSETDGSLYIAYFDGTQSFRLGAFPDTFSATLLTEDEYKTQYVLSKLEGKVSRRFTPEFKLVGEKKS